MRYFQFAIAAVKWFFASWWLYDLPLPCLCTFFQQSDIGARFYQCVANDTANVNTRFLDMLLSRTYYITSYSQAKLPIVILINSLGASFKLNSGLCPMQKDNENKVNVKQCELNSIQV